MDGNSPRNCDSDHAGGRGDIGQADLLDALLGKEREEGGDDLVAIAGRCRGVGGGISRRLRRRFTGGFAGRMTSHDELHN